MAGPRSFYLVLIFALFTSVSFLTLCAWAYLVTRKFPYRPVPHYCLVGRFLDLGLTCIALAFVVDYPPTAGRSSLLVTSLWFSTWVEVSQGAKVFLERLINGHIDDLKLQCHLEIAPLVLSFNHRYRY